MYTFNDLLRKYSTTNPNILTTEYCNAFLKEFKTLDGDIEPWVVEWLSGARKPLRAKTFLYEYSRERLAIFCKRFPEEYKDIPKPILEDFCNIIGGSLAIEEVCTRFEKLKDIHILNSVAILLIPKLTSSRQTEVDIIKKLSKNSSMNLLLLDYAFNGKKLDQFVIDIYAYYNSPEAERLRPLYEAGVYNWILLNNNNLVSLKETLLLKQLLTYYKIPYNTLNQWVDSSSSHFYDIIADSLIALSINCTDTWIPKHIQVTTYNNMLQNVPKLCTYMDTTAHTFILWVILCCRPQASYSLITKIFELLESHEVSPIELFVFLSNPNNPNLDTYYNLGFTTAEVNEIIKSVLPTFSNSVKTKLSKHPEFKIIEGVLK